MIAIIMNNERTWKIEVLEDFIVYPFWVCAPSTFFQVDKPTSDVGPVEEIIQCDIQIRGLQKPHPGVYM